MRIAHLIIFIAVGPLAFGASVTATAGKNSISVTWTADAPIRYVTVCSKPGQFNPALVCSGANEDGDVKKTLQPPQTTGTEPLTGLAKNKWYTIKVKGIPENGSTRKLIGVIKVKTTK